MHYWMDRWMKIKKMEGWVDGTKMVLCNVEAGNPPHTQKHTETHTHAHTHTRTQDKILKHLVVNTHLIPECPFCLDSSIYSVVERDVPLRKHPYDYNHSFSLQMSEMRPFFQLQRDGKYTITSNTCICI